MKWQDIRGKHPNKFILIGDLVEEKLSKTKSRIIEGTILEVSENSKEIRKAYRRYQQQGRDVLYSLPSTPDEFIVENVPFKGILK